MSIISGFNKVKNYVKTTEGYKLLSRWTSSDTVDVNGKTLTEVVNELGTASKKDIAASGNASTTQVVMGNDTRLTDARKASDVSAWAKASTKPTYTASEVGAYTKTETDTKLNGKANSSHTHGNGDITSLDASKITSGTISIDRLPQGALERLTVVADDTARFKLTSSTVQKGDTVKVTATGKMYYVVDETKLSTEAGYEVYAAGTAASVPWSGVTGKPSTYIPSSHTHTKSQITDFPTSMPANGGNSSTVNGHTVNADVPSGAKFTDTNTWRPQPDWNATSGDAVIKNKPVIPSVGNGTITITQNGASKGTFTMNQSGNTTIALTDTNTDTNTVTNIGTTSSNYTNGNILIQGRGATTVSKSGNTVTISSTNTDTNTWRPLGTTADTACAGNDSRLSDARPANGGTSTYANYVWATSHQGSWYQNSQWDGTYFQTNYKNGDNVLPMKVNNAGYADSAGSVAWSNVSGRPSSMPASDVYSWAKAAKKPSYTASEVGAAAANHSHSNYLTGITKSMVTSALGYTPPTSDTNTWRGIQNNLTSTSTTDSLSAYQGKLLNDKITTLNSNLTKGDIQSVSGNGYTVYYRKLSGNFYYISLDKTLASVGETRNVTILTLPIKPINGFVFPLFLHVGGYVVATGWMRIYDNGALTLTCPAYPNSIQLTATGIIYV